MKTTSAFSLFLVVWSFLPLSCRALSSTFHGTALTTVQAPAARPSSVILEMRKQKASNKRTRRRQQGRDDQVDPDGVSVVSPAAMTTAATAATRTLTSSPMSAASWSHKQVVGASTTTTSSSSKNMRGSDNYSSMPSPTLPSKAAGQRTGGRQRSRKRSTLYNALHFYHNAFLHQLTAEYQAEEEEVLGRIKAGMDDPLGLEIAGFALFDMIPQRRGNLFSDEVYRLSKANDATTTYPRNNLDTTAEEETTTSPNNNNNNNNISYLPPNHKFSTNDVIMITLQPHGSGDFFSPQTCPASDNDSGLICTEARVLNMGPTYLDVALPAGSFEAAFGPAPNDYHAASSSAFSNNNNNKNARLRVDRFFSNVPYQRMVTALAAISAIPERTSQKLKATLDGRNNHNNNKSLKTTGAAEETADSSTSTPPPPSPAHQSIAMDEVLREMVLQTYAYADPFSPLRGDPDACDLHEMSNYLSKPPMATSHKLANQALKYLRSNPQGIFPAFNAPQRAAIEAALTRRMTMIQGPPGTGKTTVAAAIAFGFAHQCRSLSVHTKVLACAFSNVGADNLAEAIRKLGLKVVRVGKPSAVSESLWDCTLDAAIDQDPDAQQALQRAAKATAQLAKLNQRRNGKSSASVSERSIRESATLAVKASIQACNIAATKALREADVVISTSTGAADPRLLAACGIVTSQEEEEMLQQQRGRRRIGAVAKKGASISPSSAGGHVRENAPDGLPPLSLPFVLVDEACQSVEPATLVPLTASNSCRSLVMLGDPCQLPPTVKSRQASGLSLSLMERLASILPHPSVSNQVDSTMKETSYLDSLPIKQAKSLIRARTSGEAHAAAYRKRFSGSLLLSIQYRFSASIAAFPSAVFYDNLLSTPSFMANERSFPRVLKEAMPCADSDLGVRLIDVGGRANERQGVPSRFTRTVFGSSAPARSSLEDRTTYWNEAEAERVVALIKDIIGDKDREVASLGVVTPYNGQVQLIKSMIASDADLRQLISENPVAIEVKSVDGYQGRERDVIIFSAVRSNRQARIGFLHDWRRMNVALTRAKSGLVVVGDLDTLSEADKHWDALCKWGTGVRCITEDFDCPDDEASL